MTIKEFIDHLDCNDCVCITIIDEKNISFVDQFCQPYDWLIDNFGNVKIKSFYLDCDYSEITININSNDPGLEYFRRYDTI